MSVIFDVLNDADFDSVYKIDRLGTITYSTEDFAPEVYTDPDTDVEIYGTGWKALTGHTGQYGYNGAVMHPSELFHSGMASELASLANEHANGIIVALVAVYDQLPHDDACGWAVVWRPFSSAQEPV